MDDITAGDIHAWLNLPYTQKILLPKLKKALNRLEEDLFAKNFASIEEMKLTQEKRRFCLMLYSDPIKALDEINEQEKRSHETTEERKF